MAVMGDGGVLGNPGDGDVVDHRRVLTVEGCAPGQRRGHRVEAAPAGRDRVPVAVAVADVPHHLAGVVGRQLDPNGGVAIGVVRHGHGQVVHRIGRSLVDLEESDAVIEDQHMIAAGVQALEPAPAAETVGQHRRRRVADVDHLETQIPVGDEGLVADHGDPPAAAAEAERANREGIGGIGDVDHSQAGGKLRQIGVAAGDVQVIQNIWRLVGADENGRGGIGDVGHEELLTVVPQVGVIADDADLLE